MKKDESFDYLSEWFTYDTDSPSCLSWRKRPRRSPVQAGDHCATWAGRYYRVRLNGHYYQCSRVILVLHGLCPAPGQVADHIDRNTRNNNIKNLRWLTHAQNIKNSSKMGATGFRFVTARSNGTYEARYRPHKGSTMINCGTYKHPHAAHIAALAHRLEHYWNP
jgi:hypothetical protein